MYIYFFSFVIFCQFFSLSSVHICMGSKDEFQLALSFNIYRPSLVPYMVLLCTMSCCNMKVIFKNLITHDAQLARIIAAASEKTYRVPGTANTQSDCRLSPMLKNGWPEGWCSAVLGIVLIWLHILSSPLTPPKILKMFSITGKEGASKQASDKGCASVSPSSKIGADMSLNTTVPSHNINGKYRGNHTRS